MVSGLSRGVGRRGGGGGVGGGDQCCSREWTWNSRTKVCWKIVGKGIVSVTLLQEFYVGYIMF